MSTVMYIFGQKMKLSSYRRIITQDFTKEDQELIEQLGSNINDGFNSLYSVLNKRTSFADNIACTVKQLVVTVDASGDLLQTVQFAVDVLNTPIIGLMVVEAKNLTNPGTYPTSAPWASFIQNGNNIVISNIKGLQANQQYRIRIIAIN